MIRKKIETIAFIEIKIAIENEAVVSSGSEYEVLKLKKELINVNRKLKSIPWFGYMPWLSWKFRLLKIMINGDKKIENLT